MDHYAIALINPNSSQATSNMMAALAKQYLPENCELQVITAEKTPKMLVSAQDVILATHEVERISQSLLPSVDAILIAAFGDPALQVLRKTIPIPVVGIGEASLLAASAHQRPFAVATVTPELRESITHYIATLGLSPLCRGVFITESEPEQLMNNPPRQEQQLYDLCQLALAQGAEAIVIGGGPLAPAAERLKHRLPIPVISPLIAGVEAVLTHMFDNRKKHPI